MGMQATPCSSAMTCRCSHDIHAGSVPMAALDLVKPQHERHVARYVARGAGPGSFLSIRISATGQLPCFRQVKRKPIETGVFDSHVSKLKLCIPSRIKAF